MKSSLFVPLLVCNPSFKESDKGGKCKLPYLKQCNNWWFEWHFVFDFPKGIVAGATQTVWAPRAVPGLLCRNVLTYTSKMHTSTQCTHAKCSCRRGLCATRKTDLKTNKQKISVHQGKLPITPSAKGDCTLSTSENLLQ